MRCQRHSRQTSMRKLRSESLEESQRDVPTRLPCKLGRVALNQQRSSRREIPSQHRALISNATPCSPPPVPPRETFCRANILSKRQRMKCLGQERDGAVEAAGAVEGFGGGCCCITQGRNPVGMSGARRSLMRARGCESAAPAVDAARVGGAGKCRETSLRLGKDCC